MQFKIDCLLVLCYNFSVDIVEKSEKSVFYKKILYYINYKFRQ